MHDSAPLYVIGTDPGQTHPTGLASWLVGSGLQRWISMRINRAGWTDQDGVDAVMEMVPLGAKWLWLIEQPFGLRMNPRARKAGGKPQFQGRPPTYAYETWKRIRLLFARQRAEKLGIRYRVPMEINIQPSVWRSPLGLPTHAPKGMFSNYDDARAWLKTITMDRIEMVHGIAIDQPDAADAAAIAWWGGERIAAFGKLWVPGSRKPPRDLKWTE